MVDTTILHTASGHNITPVSSTNPLRIDPTGTTTQPVSGTVSTVAATPVAADVIVGHLAHTATTAAAAFLTVAAGETWRGTVAIVCDVAVAAASATAGQALGIVATAGTGVTPPAASVLSCEARAGANAATGTAGSQQSNSIAIQDFVLIAPVGNSVTLTGDTTIAGTNGRVSYSANGVYL